MAYIDSNNQARLNDCLIHEPIHSDSLTMGQLMSMFEQPTIDQRLVQANLILAHVRSHNRLQRDNYNRLVMLQTSFAHDANDQVKIAYARDLYQTLQLLAGDHPTADCINLRQLLQAFRADCRPLLNETTSFILSETDERDEHSDRTLHQARAQR